jgi:hypothetical protein
VSGDDDEERSWRKKFSIEIIMTGQFSQIKIIKKRKI